MVVVVGGCNNVGVGSGAINVGVGEVGISLEKKICMKNSPVFFSLFFGM